MVVPLIGSAVDGSNSTYGQLSQVIWNGRIRPDGRKELSEALGERRRDQERAIYGI